MRGSELPELPETPGLPEYAERVLDVAERIPQGRVMTYGDVAEWLKDEARAEAEAASGAGGGAGGGSRSAGAGARQALSGGPRQVGRVLALYGGAVPWWRIVRADGVLLPGHELRAMDQYREEGTPLRPAPPAAEGHIPRLDLRRARWDGAVPESRERTEG
ncbi:MGMT family protein [Streptomyces sp. N2-109]|uniref:MGMT family protein n=1 Tax=Streptomyces gossypii TaxID=2883101 RepID=A0ABT2JWR2_9ACTN|nr:MGMT family protein [Streptomyces gossypii]MCT2591889.1 MGMT family protein [Streptomyces gossypii]